MNWKSLYKGSETKEQALIRMYTDPKMLEENGSWRAFLDFLAARFDTTKMAINKKLERLQKEGKVKRHLVPDSHSYGTQKLITLDKKFPDANMPEKFLDLIIRGNKLLNEQDVRQTEVFPEIKGRKWIGLVIAGDWHFEHFRTDTEEIVRMLKEIGQEPNLYYGFNGDLGDFIDLRFFELENETVNIPLKRRIEVIKYLVSLVPNMLFMVCGCHDQWVRTRGRRDIIEEVQATIKGYYLGFGGTVNLKVGDVVYRIAAWHKFKHESQMNAFHPNMNYLRLIDSTADIVSLSHRHDIVGISHVFWQGQPRVFTRSGSEQWRTEYAWKEGFRGAINQYPMILLNGTEKRMIALINYKEGIQVLRALNKGVIDADELVKAGEDNIRRC